MITDYTSLKQAIADWLARADLTNQIPTFIQLAEARMNKDLRVLEMQTEYTVAISPSRALSLPGEVLEIQSVRAEVFGKYFETPPLPPTRLADLDIESAVPLGYVRVGDVLYIIGGRVPSETVPGPGEPVDNVLFNVLYFAKLPVLGSITEGGTPLEPVLVEITSNWLLQKEPGLYLYAALIEASPYLQDDARTLVWAEQYKSILMAMRIADDNARYGNAPSLSMRGYTP